ncbi:unnamed protein product [Caenorhabditis sp. 36 PRJEB53466]|nr:unnamed protein product [Caenorhabditis sp. 36 PRJEB53466]
MQQRKIKRKELERRTNTKCFTIGLQQATKSSQCWRKIYLADKTKFVFQNETRQLIGNRSAMAVVSEISKVIYRACIQNLAWVRNQMQAQHSGFLDTHQILLVFHEFAANILNGKLWNKHEFEFYHPTMMEPLIWAFEAMTKISVPYTSIRAVRILSLKFRQFFRSLGVKLTPLAIFGLVTQLICFISTICLDMISQYLQIHIDGMNVVIIGYRDDFYKYWNDWDYLEVPKSYYEFCRLNGLTSFRETGFIRDPYKSTVWHQILYSEYFHLMSHVFDFTLIKKIPHPTVLLLQSFLVRLQIRMRNYVVEDRLKKLCDTIFNVSERTEPPFYKESIRKEDAQQRMAELVGTVLGELLVDDEMGISLFCEAWKTYTLTMCKKTDVLIEFKKFGKIAKEINDETYRTLVGLEMNSDQNKCVFLFMFAQLLRFVLRFAMHTVRMALRVTVEDRRISHLRYTGRIEIGPRDFGKMDERALAMAQVPPKQTHYYFQSPEY